MKTKYKIWDIVWIKAYRHTLISPILYIRDYWDFIEYWVHQLGWVIEADIIWKMDSEWNIIF